MEFFLDTADLAEIEHWQALGLVDGVTTNPALLGQGGMDPIRRIKDIAAVVGGPISVEVTLDDPAAMIEQAVKLNALGDNILIKIPADRKGFLCAKELKKKGIRVNVTLVFHASQAVPFIKLGSEYISLFVARVEDFGLDNIPMIAQARRIVDNMGSASKILAASIRNPKYLVEAIEAPADALTVPPSTWEKVYNNPMFFLGEREFMQSWCKLSPELRQEYESTCLKQGA
ncbi:MAG: fructose-6-phosphate aldolase [Desulfovibrionaceae bacterium]|nr:fructose-6-phosphate aldolase [Desulfovibrionaceae bacterium]MBF0512657.1 fructose-6-phosphate aldolase [Desulfovibrionaceae bacterium]